MNPQPPYCGQTQVQRINVPATIAYKYIDSEDGPWVMPPYASIYPPPAPAPTESRFSLWNRMQVLEGSQFSSEVHNRP
jgi:hypothetical protein